MTKLELAIREVEWKIEDAQKEYEEAREGIKRNIESPDCYIAEFILQRAQQMEKAENELRRLYQQKKVLEAIAEEQ